MFEKKVELNKLAQLEYHGTPGITQDCLDALAVVLQFGEPIKSAWLISGEKDHSGCRDHALILNSEAEHQTVINSGFRSGYGGEGPKGLSKAIQLLEKHEIQIQEFEVKQTLISRIQKCCLLTKDLEKITDNPIHGGHFYDYIWYDPKKGGYTFDDTAIKQLYKPAVPLAIVDQRIFDLALMLEEQPDETLFKGYRRLEGIVREMHPDLELKSAKDLFTQAYLRKDSALYWPALSASECEGRAHLFIGAFQVYRNERIHNEPNHYDLHSAVREFLLLNELYVLQSSSIVRPHEEKID